jgi:hypothetical protein
MPLSSVTCPICLATLKTKTPVPEGSRVRCPKCKGSFTAEAEPHPEEHEPQLAPEPTPEPTQEPMPSAVEQADEDVMEVVEAEAEEAPPRRTTRGRREDEDDQPRGRVRDEDEEGDRPQTRKASKGISAWVWLVSGGAALVLLCGCCGIAGVVGISLMGGSGPVTATNYQLLKKGMSPAEVRAILGPPTTTSPGFGGLQVESWQNGTDIITVNFQNGKAVSRSCNIQHNGAIQLQDSGILPW